MTDTEPRDYPIEECIRTVEPLVESGATFFQKFTCAHCRSRQTMEQPNTFFESGACEECGELTDIKKSGCNYVLMYGVS